MARLLTVNIVEESRRGKRTVSQGKCHTRVRFEKKGGRRVAPGLRVTLDESDFMLASYVFMTFKLDLALALSNSSSNRTTYDVALNPDRRLSKVSLNNVPSINARAISLIPAQVICFVCSACLSSYRPVRRQAIYFSAGRDPYMVSTMMPVISVR